VIISFAWTTPALLAGAKTITRREWTEDHALRFDAGDLVKAYDKSPRAHGRQVAEIRLTRDPYAQNTRNLTDNDFLREGFSWLVLNGTQADRDRVQRIWEEWHVAPRALWVVEFELVDRVA
jgi:uncharacterized protein YqfB (UPF0267 family)